MNTATLQSTPALSKSKLASGDVTDVDDLAARIDTRSPIRLGFWVLIVGFGAFLTWAAFAPLDEGVSAPATVSISARTSPILIQATERKRRLRPSQRCPRDGTLTSPTIMCYG